MKQFKIIFSIWEILELPHILPLYNKLKEFNKYYLKIMYKEDCFNNALKKALDKNNCDYVPYTDLKNQEADLLITSTYDDETKPIPCKKWIQLFHGVADKDYTYKNYISRYDEAFLIGNFALDRFKQNDIPIKKCSLIGFPKQDWIINNKTNLQFKKSVYGKYRLDPKKTTILYAPTWGMKNLSSFPKAYKYLTAYAIKNKINLIIKLHAHLYDAKLMKLHSKTISDCKQYIESIEEVRNISKKHTNIVLAPKEDYDISPLFLIADLMVSDFSSAGFEFLIMDRPIIFLDTFKINQVKNPNYQTKRMEYFMRGCGITVEDITKLELAIEKSLKYPNIKNNIRKKYLNYLFYKPDGHATERAYNRIIELLEEINNKK